MTEDLIAAFVAHVRDTRAQSTADTYLDVLRRLDRELPVPLPCACTDELKAVVFVPGRGPATRAQHRAILCEFFRWCTDPGDEKLDYDPARLLPHVTVPQRKPRPLTPEQFRRILEHAARPYWDWYAVAGLAGARCCEIAELTAADIGARWTLLHGKGSRDREVPTHPLLAALAERLPPGPVAGGLDRRQVSRRGNYHLYRIDRSAHMHRLRTTFASAAYEDCKDLRTVQELLGHRSVATTQAYIGLPSGAMEAAVRGAGDRLLAA